MIRKTDGAFLRFFALALLAVGVWALSRYAQSVPSPLGQNAAPAVFSSARASETLARILGPQAPRQAGSPENARARERIVQELARLGVRSELQRRFYCSGARSARSIRCTTVTNIIGHVVEGNAPALVLMAHYDSVAAGPGAGDDASGVATILESVRALKAAPMASRNPLLVLFTDGEEAGLIGARAFLQVPEWRAHVGAVVNVEARGTSGQSLLFQTSPGDAALISAYAANVNHFAASSLFALIYRALPNDTDLTPFLTAGIPGVNFAFIEGAQRYHTALDRQEFLDPVTLQQHGDNVLGITRGLLQTDFATLSGGDDAIYLSVLGAWLPRLPASWALPLSLLLLAGVVVSTILRSDARADRKNWIRSLAVVPLLLLGAVAAGFLLHTIAALISGSSNPAYAHPVALRISLTLGLAAMVLLVSRLWNIRVATGAIWIWPALFGVITAAFLPGLSPYFIFPALIAAPLLLAVPFLPNAAMREVAIGLAAVPALFVWLGMTAQGEGVMGLMIHPLFTVTAAFAVLGLVPLFGLEALSRQAWLYAVAFLSVTAITAAVVAGLQPAYSSAAPQRLNLAYIEDHITGRAVWSADTLTPPLRAAAQFSDTPQSVLPLNMQRGYVAEAGRAHLTAPGLNILSDVRTAAGRVIEMLLLGGAQTASMHLAIPEAAGLRYVSIDGREMASPPDRDGDLLVSCLGSDCNGVRIVLTLGATNSFELAFAEQRRGLPPQAAPLIAARGDIAVPSQGGDVTIVLNKTKIP